MMRIDILTIFPSIFESFLGESLLSKGIEKGLLEIHIHDIRKYSKDKHKKVDDMPYGGGAGMVMSPQPIVDALRDIKSESESGKTLLLSPGGKPLSQIDAARFSKEKSLVLICGRYEGIDQRIHDSFVDEEISIGDFVLNGGEVAAMAVIEAVFRLIPGAVGSEESVEFESYNKNLLEHPQYTRPEDFEGMKVPGVLLSGNHKEIEKWRLEKSLEKTESVRPDLFAKGSDEIKKNIKFSMALVHYPVLGKKGETITGSITTLDVHDFARIGKTYSAETVYVITPVEDQQRLIERLYRHWTESETLKELDGRRTEALDIVKVVPSIGAMIKDAKKRGRKIKILATSAVDVKNSVSPARWLKSIKEGEEWIVLYGTAYGLAPELIESADAVLEPIDGRGEFNHLPVRGASAIITDRLLGNLRR